MDSRNRGRDRTRGRNRVQNRRQNHERTARATDGCADRGHATRDKSDRRHNLYRRMPVSQPDQRQSAGSELDGPESELEPGPVLETLALPVLDTVVVLAPPRGASPVLQLGVPPGPELPMDK